MIGSKTLPGIILALVCGCGAVSVRDYTAGMVGCIPEEVVIIRDSGFGFSRAWTAQCRGRTYQCSGAGGDQDRCTEIKPPEPPARAANSASGS